MGLDKRNIPIIISVGTGKFCLNEALLMSTHKICFCGEIRKTEQYFLAEQSTFNLSFDTLPSPKYCYTITRIIDNIFLVFFFFLFFFFVFVFPGNRLQHFMQIVSFHEISKPIFWEK